MKRIFTPRNVKILSISLFFTLQASGVFPQSKQQDSLAILIVDRMSDVIGNLESCSYHLSTTTDIVDPLFGHIKELASFEVFISGPDKMLVNAHGYRGHRQLMYNGNELAYYSFDENNYGILPVPATTIQMIDSVHTHYGIEFPAADFFYPAFTDDLLNEADLFRFLGIVRMEGKEYFHLVASTKDKNIEFWINNDAYNLPAKFVITYKTQKGNPQYHASFSDWQINPVLPEAIFDFLPPAGAAQVRIMSQNEQ
ncbi:MAG: DUF2092 domain-containing protein [Tannerella sp.]|jgi:hypothetical protein|nr:DUF2092 domain-containing protein [Tannerella sp.]